MTPEINQDYYNFISSVIKQATLIPDGYDIPDYYLIKFSILIDETKKFNYRPYVVLRFGNSYIDDQYLVILLSPEFTKTTFIEE